MLLIRLDRVNRHEGDIIILSEDFGMSMGESASLYVLARESYVESFVKQGSEGQSFSISPINAFSFFQALFSLLVDLFNLRMEFDIFREGVDSFAQVF